MELQIASQRIEEPFARCSMCHATWDDLDHFLGECDIEVVGYQVHFQKLETGLFLFNHYCGSTFAVPVDRFMPLKRGPIFEDRRTGQSDCPGFCLHRQNLDPCPAHCECAYVRDILQVIRQRMEPKQVAG